MENLPIKMGRRRREDGGEEDVIFSIVARPLEVKADTPRDETHWSHDGCLPLFK